MKFHKTNTTNVDKEKFLIINRTFWPDNDVIGEALLVLAERSSKKIHTFVICLSSENLQEKLLERSRGLGVAFKAMNALTTSSSGLFSRVLESFLFTAWTSMYLLRIRPNKIYFSTDPPLIIPFIVYVYSKFFNCKYFYHLQDIHPEATKSFLKINNVFYKFLVFLDNLTINGSEKIITLSKEMKDYIVVRSNTNKHIALISNCAIKSSNSSSTQKDNEFIFCGNLGRFQIIPILVESIDTYLNMGGVLKFTFIGSGIHSNLVEDLAEKHLSVSYLGKLPSDEASDYISKKRWAILSIEDEITKYAFPSKTSSYIINDCNIFAICGENTSIAKFINRLDLGIVSKPFAKEIVKNLFKVENKPFDYELLPLDYKKELTVDYFVDSIINIVEL